MIQKGNLDDKAFANRLELMEGIKNPDWVKNYGKIRIEMKKIIL